MIIGKNVVLTGASSGIGKAIANELASAGAKLILIGRNEERLLQVQQSLGEKHQALVADISTEEGRNSIVKACQQVDSGIDILINAAGVEGFTGFEEMSQEQISSIIHINLTSTIILTQALLPILRENSQPQIINIGSAFAGIAFPAFAVYSASKFGLRGFTEALRRELMDSDIAVRYFAPRGTDTPFNNSDVAVLNRELKVTIDSPEQVAKEFIGFIRTKKPRYSIGRPEKIFTFMNNVFPSVVDKALFKQLAIIKRCLPKNKIVAK